MHAGARCFAAASDHAGTRVFFRKKIFHSGYGERKRIPAFLTITVTANSPGSRALRMLKNMD